MRDEGLRFSSDFLDTVFLYSIGFEARQSTAGDERMVSVMSQVSYLSENLAV